jgi:hypothetical protein
MENEWYSNIGLCFETGQEQQQIEKDDVREQRPAAQSHAYPTIVLQHQYDPGAFVYSIHLNAAGDIGKPLYCRHPHAPNRGQTGL